MNQRRIERRAGWIAAAVMAVGAAAGAAVAQPRGGGGPPPATVMTDPVRVETIEQWREVTGELRATVRSTLAARRAGLVVQLNVEAGDRVEAGRVLAKLDDRDARLAVEQAQATIETRKAVVREREAELGKAQRDLARMQTSFNRAGATQSELDDAESAVAIAEAQLSQAQTEVAWGESDLRIAEKYLDDMTIKAPFKGTVVAKRTEVGQWVNEGGAVVEMVALDSIDAWLDVPEAAVGRLKNAGEGAEVQVRVPALGAGETADGTAGDTLSATVTAVVPQADPLSRLFPVRVRLANAENRLKPGMSVIGMVPTGAMGPSMTISKDAVLSNEAGAYVYFDAGGVAAIAPVSVRRAVGTRVVVSSPMLREGMEVVVEGNERMFPGQPLMRTGAGGGK